MPLLPILLHFGRVSLPTFGVLTALGLMLALALSQRTARLAGVNPDALWDASLFAIIAAFVLSRMLLVLENFAGFRAFPLLLLALPSLTASGMLLTAVATWAWLRWKRVPVLHALDAWAPCGTAVWASLALGHWAEGSDPGMRGHPVALYAFGVAALLTVASEGLLARSARLGQTAGGTLMAVGVAQFFLSFLREPGLSGLASLDALQWVAVGIMLAGGAFWMFPEGNEINGRAGP